MGFVKGHPQILKIYFDFEIVNVLDDSNIYL